MAAAAKKTKTISNRDARKFALRYASYILQSFVDSDMIDFQMYDDAWGIEITSAEDVVKVEEALISLSKSLGSKAS